MREVGWCDTTREVVLQYQGGGVTLPGRWCYIIREVVSHYVGVGWCYTMRGVVLGLTSGPQSSAPLAQHSLPCKEWVNGLDVRVERKCWSM